MLLTYLCGLLMGAPAGVAFMVYLAMRKERDNE